MTRAAFSRAYGFHGDVSSEKLWSELVFVEHSLAVKKQKKDFRMENFIYLRTETAAAERGTHYVLMEAVPCRGSRPSCLRFYNKD